MATNSNPNADDFAAMIGWLKRASVTNHPYVKIRGNDRLADTYPAMMHAIAAHLEAVNDHPDTSTCFIGGILECLGADIPHDHPTASDLPVEDHQDEAPGEVMPQEDQDAILAGFMRALDGLPTAEGEGAERTAVTGTKPRFYLAEGNMPADGAPTTLVVDRQTGMAYPFSDAEWAQRGLDALSSGRVTMLFGDDAERYGITVEA